MFIDTWKVSISNLWILQAVKGFKTPIVSLTQPGHNTMLAKSVFPPEQAVQRREELRLLLEKGAIASMTDSHEGFYSNLFLVLKKNSQMRSVINLKWLNKWVTTEYFEMEGISALKDAYFTIPIKYFWPPSVPEVHAGS